MVIVTRIEDFLPLGKKFIYHNFMNNAIRKKLSHWRGSFKGFKYLKDLKQQLANGGTCLIKASHSMNFETIFKELKK